MASLRTRFLGIEFLNPFVLASGPPTADANRIIEAFKAGWGGAVLETVSLVNWKKLGSGVFIMRSGGFRWGSVEVEAVSELSVEQWGDEIDRIRNSFPDRPIIASIVGGNTSSSWQELVGRLQEHPINGFEVNAGLPLYTDDGPEVIELGQNRRALAQAVRWVRNETDLPLIVKLSPNVTDILPIARAAEDAGADGFTATSGLSGVGGVDPSDLEHGPWGEGVGLAGEYTGPGLKPVALRWTACIAKSLLMPLMGCGGVSTWEDAAEYLAVGASAVQLRNAVIWHGTRIIDDLRSGFERYLERMNFGGPEELVGRALSRIVGFDELDLGYKLVATIDESECIGCELCMRVCNDAGFQAIRMDGSIAKIGKSKCDGCGLCIYVCPPDIMMMVPREQTEA